MKTTLSSLKSLLTRLWNRGRTVLSSLKSLLARLWNRGRTALGRPVDRPAGAAEAAEATPADQPADEPADRPDAAGRLPRRRVVLIATVAAPIALALGTMAVWPSGSDPDPAPKAQPASATGGPTTLIATPIRAIEAFGEPGGAPVGTVADTWHGRMSWLPVIAEQPDWLHVRLPERPNGSTAWVRRADVRLASTPYRIEVDVATTRLRLYEYGKVVLDAPAGVGRDRTPTAVGNFFVAFFQEAPNEGWGPFVIVTSGHSEAISDWKESGDAVIAIHGPVGAEAEIGDTGTRISAGCIRLHADDLAALRYVPAGSPVDIVDSRAV